MIPCRAEILEFGSKAQIQSIGLRYEILRKPLGLVYQPEELAAENDEIHFGLLRGEYVLAVLLLRKVNLNTVKMRQVAVVADEQGKGHGKKLVEYSENWCLNEGITTIELNARESAVPFYISLGYVVASDLFTEVGIPHFKMIKNL